MNMSNESIVYLLKSPLSRLIRIEVRWMLQLWTCWRGRHQILSTILLSISYSQCLFWKQFPSSFLLVFSNCNKAFYCNSCTCCRLFISHRYKLRCCFTVCDLVSANWTTPHVACLFLVLLSDIFLKLVTLAIKCYFKNGHLQQKVNNDMCLGLLSLVGLMSWSVSYSADLHNNT